MRLPLIQSNAASSISGLLEKSDPASWSLPVTDGFSRHNRLIAVVSILSDGNRLAFFTHLSFSGNAYADWLARQDLSVKCTSRNATFYDAIVACDLNCAKRIWTSSAAGWSRGKEYEEDFAYARILQAFACADSPEAEVKHLLDFWKGVSGGGEIRFNLCQALLDKDADAAKEALTALLDERLKEVRKRQKEESGDPDERATTDRMCLEAAAVVKIAKRNRGLDIRVQHVQLPDDLLVEPTKPLPPPDAWKNIDSYRSLS